MNDSSLQFAIERGILMKEEQFKQLSLFDEEEAEEQTSTIQDYSIKDIRYTLYKNLYSFSQVKELIDFLLKIEFEENNFEKCEFLALLLELSFDNLKEDISSINTFEDLYNKRIFELEEENKIKFKKYEEYNEKISSFLNDCCIYSEEQGNFNANVNSYFEASANIIEIEKFLNSLPESAKKSRKYNEQLEDLERIKGKKEEAFKFLNDLTTKKELPFDIVYKYNDLSNKMFEETNFEYLSGFEASDYLQALYYVNAGIRENNPETIKFIDFFNSGLQMIKDYLKQASESGEDQQSPFEDEIKKIQSLNDVIIKLPEGELKNNLIRYRNSLLNEEDLQSSIYTNKGRPKTFALISGMLGKNFSSVMEFEDKFGMKNPIKTEIQIENINKGGMIVSEEFKPILNATITYYLYYGTETPFSLIQFYEDFYCTQFHASEKTSMKNIEEVDKMINELRYTTAKIKLIKKTEEGELISEQEIRIEDILLPLRRYEVEERTFKTASGEIVKASNNVFYKFTSKPILYEYSEYFETRNILKYNREMWLDLPKGKKMKKATARTNLIRDELLKRIILIKESKGTKNQLTPLINLKKFLKDYCGIDYSKQTPKQKENLRETIYFFLDLFVSNQQISKYEKNDLTIKIIFN